MENTAAYNATFSAGLLAKIVDQYKDTSDHITLELNKRLTNLDISNPLVQISLDLFNDIVEWIERELGSANLKMIGIIMGETAFKDLRSRNKINEKLSPKEAIEKLPMVSQSLIIDPLNRNWKILEISDNFARIKKSQIFHTTIQIGIIESFIRKAGVVFPRTRLVRDYKKGPAFDEFEITWY
ncbi:hypothetical protein ACFLTE_11045 [Bacteroidota bacterium]